MNILGISCFYHESAACLLVDGKILAASAEERFTRVKHDNSMPKLAIDFCLKKAHMEACELDYVVFYEKPFSKFQRILQSVLADYPFTSMLFAKGMSNWLTDRLWVKSILADTLGVSSDRILFVPHHLSHAAASFYPSGFTEAAVLTVDGVGEWTTTAMGMAKANEIILTKEIRFPHSLGLLYSAFTAFLGFEVNDGEYKVMGMAPYGKPVYLDKVRKLVNVFSDGSFQLNMGYFSYQHSTETSYSRKFVSLFGPPRPKDLHFFTGNSGYPSYFGPKPANYKALCRLNEKYANIAASIQAFTEERLLVLVDKLHKESKMDSLVLGGGVALNSVANGKLLTKSPFKHIFIQPAAGDDGGAMGAALYAHYALLGGTGRFKQTDAYFGYETTDAEIELTLRKEHIPFTKFSTDKTLVEYLAKNLVAGKVVGFYHGKAEWGPRALGARSIIASPRSRKMKDLINVQVKFREPYRPFAPVVLAERAEDYFEFDGKDHSDLANFMLGVFSVKKSKRKVIPAVTHIDGSARPQIITRKQNSRYYDIIKRFGELTGVHVLMNTSFNLKGEPIVNTPSDALKTFRASGLDILALERYVILKRDLT